MVHSDRVDAELKASIPTPVLDLSAASEHFGPGRLYVKNDGLSGLTYGGNKTRKLAPLFERLRARDIKRVLTTGTAGSHHVLAMGLFGQAEQIETQALLFPQAHTPHTERILRAISTLDLDLLPCESAWDALRQAPKLLTAGSAWIGPGALGAISTRGYVDAFDEWQLQSRQLALGTEVFEHHVVAAGSGGTAAGLLARLCAAKQPGRVVAVAVNRNPTLRALILAQALAVSSPSQAAELTYRQRLLVTFDAVGAGYGRSTADSTAAIEQATHFGLTLDHTYTGKAFAVATRLARECPNDIVVFWQTLSQRPLEPWLERAPLLSHLDPALRRLLID